MNRNELINAVVIIALNDMQNIGIPENEIRKEAEKLTNSELLAYLDEYGTN